MVVGAGVRGEGGGELGGKMIGMRRGFFRGCFEWGGGARKGMVRREMRWGRVD